MKCLLVLLLYIVFCFNAFAQNKEMAEILVTEGVALEDSGKSDQAVMRYQAALDADKDNLAALAEMAYSLLSLKSYDESIKYCRKAIKTHPGEPILQTVYVTYGNAYDGLKKSSKAIDIYDEGIKQFPTYNLLYFNKGITLWRNNNTDQSLACFEKSAVLNPAHPGTQNAIGKISLEENKKIPSLMAYSRLITLAPRSERAATALENIIGIMTVNAIKNGADPLTINISTDLMNGKDKRQKMNDFDLVEFRLTLSSALDYDSSMSNKSDLQKFLRKFDSFCESLKEIEKDNYGFYWDYYVPYFIDMKEKGLTTTFTYIAFATTEKPSVNTWLSEHKPELTAFFKWSDEFEWKIQ